MAFKVYVGRRRHCPPGVPRLDEYDELHPGDFAAVPVTRDGWTNHPYVVDRYAPGDVYVCSAEGVRPLAEHPRWGELHAEFSPGEFWTLMGEAWVG